MSKIISKFLLTYCGKFAITRKIFRQTNLVIPLVDALLSRNFSKKLCESKPSCFPHTLWSLRNFCIKVFCKISVKTTYLVKSFNITLISRNNSQVIQRFRKLHTVALHSVEKSSKIRSQFLRKNEIFSRQINATLNYLPIYYIKYLH